MDSGLILFYKNIVDKILSEINKNSDNPLILYFKKYHFLNLEMSLNCLKENISQSETSSCTAFDIKLECIVFFSLLTLLCCNTLSSLAVIFQVFFAQICFQPN